LITVASVVEGHGEVTAVPELIRRIAFAHGVWDVQAPRSHRLARAKFLDAAELGRAVELQSRRVEDRGGVVAVLDADDDCAVKLADRILAACQGQRPFALVASVREYESVLRVAHGVTPAAAEVVRDAKGEMKRLLGTYRETIDQAKLSATLDLDRARECRWFRKFEKELLAILRG
jgi:hypothetical protein